MPSRTRLVGWIVVAAALQSAPAIASRMEHATEAAGAEASARAFGTRIAEPLRHQALTRGPAWSAFTARYAGWKAEWNSVTGTPHRAFGPSIPLAGFRADERGVDAAVRRFIAAHPSLFAGAPDLQTVNVRLANGWWYVRYRQLAGGVPILNSDWEFRVTPDGRLAMFGADAHRVPEDLSVTRLLPAPVVREAAKSGLTFDPAVDRVGGGESLYLLPMNGADGTTTLRLVADATVSTQRPRANWFHWVDARTGEVVQRRNTVAQFVSGTVTSNVHTFSPLEAPVPSPQVYEYVNVGSVKVFTLGNGYYEATPSGFPTTVTTSFDAPACAIERVDGPNATFSLGNVSNGAVVNVAWTNSNSQPAERDVFYHVNLLYLFLKTIDPTWTSSDFPLSCYVNTNDGDECVAFWEAPNPPTVPSGSLRFYLAGPTCPNTGTMPDIIWHEYFHSTTYYLYFALGQPFGLTNQSLDEGMADGYAALFPDDAVIGNEFFGPGTQLRNVNNTARWPEDRNPEPHLNGLIVAGAMWDMREAIGLARAESLAHFARYGTPDDADDGVAMNEYFLEILLADDNDGNLSNGTPNFAGIVNAFNLHGIGTNYFISVDHTPLADQNTNGPYIVNALVQYTGPIGSFNSGTLYYSVNSSPYIATPMQPSSNPDEYTAEISAQSYGVVRYYMTFSDEYNGLKTLPGGAPTRNHFLFLAGPSTVLATYDMDTAPPGWAAGVGGDNATTGIWVRGDPYGTQAQPEDDHSTIGAECYVTGNINLHTPPGADDVDGGETTLLTGALNAIPGGMVHPIISYWRWYSNNTGDAPNEDYWKVDITNNSTTWVPIELTNQSSNAWVRVAFRIEDYVTPNDQVKLRFLASDFGLPSLVEAAVDDFSLVAFTPPADVPDAQPRSTFELAGAWPNPSMGRSIVRYSLARSGRVSLAVFDLQGRELASLADGDQQAGPHSVTWNGADASGQPVPSGLYFLRLRQGSDESMRRIVVSR